MLYDVPSYMFCIYTSAILTFCAHDVRGCSSADADRADVICLPWSEQLQEGLKEAGLHTASVYVKNYNQRQGLAKKTRFRLELLSTKVRLALAEGCISLPQEDGVFCPGCLPRNLRCCRGHRGNGSQEMSHEKSEGAAPKITANHP